MSYNECMQKTPPRMRVQHFIVLGVLVLLLYVVVPQVGDFGSSWTLLKDVQWGWATIALICALSTYMAGALTYQLLAFKRLAYREVLLVQLVAMFVNRLLPAGIGAVGTNFVYLRNRRHTAAQAGSVITVNNMLGFAGHSLLLVVALVWAVAGGSGDMFKGAEYSPIPLIIIAASIVIAGLLMVVGTGRIRAGLRDVARQLATYRHRPRAVLMALASSTTLTAANVLCLAVCAVALNVQLPLVAVFMVFSFGVGAGTATPTPGGLGGFEAGLVAGFMVYGVEPAAALAVALLFRLISYWIPLVLGGAAFVVAQRGQLLRV